MKWIKEAKVLKYSGGFYTMRSVLPRHIRYSNTYVLSECCKLISFSREILIGRYEDVSEVATIQLKVESRIGDVQNQIDSFSALADSEEDAKKKKEMKLKVKVAKKSIKYLSRTSDELKKAIKAYKPGKKKPLALPDKSEE